MAGFGSNFAFILIIIGAFFASTTLSILVPIGIALFGGVVVFQVVNLPVEFNASTRAKDQLATLGIVGDVREVLPVMIGSFREMKAKVEAEEGRA